jgi:hypothetical protein
MRTWIDGGIVSVDQGIITILDQDRLEMYCESW